MKNRITIIAEIGLNWNGDINLAKNLIYSAKKNGADMVKFQVFDTDSVFERNFQWYNIIKKSELDRKQIIILKNHCNKVGIEFLASVFDVERVEWLEDINVKKYKIASRSIHNRNLIKAISETGKDIIISLGMWNKKLFPKIKALGKIDYLYCVSKYPTPLGDLKFKSIDFKKYSGFSDHTIGVIAAKVAMSRGARIIEKHFTLNKKTFGPDHSGSMEPSELKDIVNFARMINKIKL